MLDHSDKKVCLKFFHTINGKYSIFVQCDNLFVTVAESDDWADV